MKIFLSAGEPSGDTHAANLIRRLQAAHSDVECVGFGGPKMAAAGCKLHFELTTLAVMGFFRVIPHLAQMFRLLAEATKYFEDQRPDAVVLVDFPGFHWGLARRAKAAGIPVFFYPAPQIWAWASYRVKRMRRYVDHVLCTLPFEEAWFRQRGCNATYVGHPFFDEVRNHPADAAFLAEQRSADGPIVAILPGSRTHEVAENLKSFLAAALRIKAAVPNVRFLVASYKPQQADMARQLAAEMRVPVEVFVGKTPELMQLATCTMAVSGSVSLELLHHVKPTVVLYQVHPFMDWLQKRMRKVKYITLVNLISTSDPFGPPLTLCDAKDPLADVLLFPEYVSSVDRSAQIAAHIIEWLTEPVVRRARVAKLEDLRQQIGAPGASQRTAEYILNVIQGRGSNVRGPHFLTTGGVPQA